MKLCHICNKMVDPNERVGHCFEDTCLAKNHKDECHVWLSMPELHAKVIAKHCSQARKAGYKRLMFVFGSITQVSFTILL